MADVLDPPPSAADGVPRPAAPRVDGLLAAAAERHGDRTAIVAEGRAIGFAELERRVSSVAAGLRELLPEPGGTVAVASVLHPDFAVAYYAAMRAGQVAAVVNPLLREEGLLHVLSVSGARVALVDTVVAERLTTLRDRLPELRHVVLIGDTRGACGPTLETLADGAPEPGGPAPDGVAALQFTSGTTGLPKAVPLTHRNLTVNAAQTAAAHQLDAASVTLNHLPTYHPMHLNSAVQAGATQVLFAGPDPADAVAAANRYGATHYYSLPVRLARLASDPSLESLALRTVARIASGGSALPVWAATRLTERFGVPVFQGYGLAETSPLTHSDDPGHPVHGSVGRPVPGTECRIVDVDTRAVLGTGEAGEVQLRGPQVMSGYLDGTGLEDGGWFSTGDVGRIDQDGRLFLVDRLKDVFKCDNFLVAPSDVERALLAHPAVKEAVVVDLPDAYSSAVAGALLVLDAGTASAAGVLADVNPGLPYYQRVRHAAAVGAIPRNGNGKIQRRELRDLLIRTVHPEPTTQTPRKAADMPEFTVVNTFTLKDPAGADAFEEQFLEHVGWMRARDGFLAHQAVRDTERAGTYVNLGWWATPEDFKQVLGSETFQAHAEEFHRIVDVEADPSMGVFRVTGTASSTSAVTVMFIEANGDAGEFEAAFRAFADAAADTGALGWLDLARSLPRPGHYTAAASWTDRAAAERAEALPQYAALAELATIRRVTAKPVAGTR
ncbi:AMP-binding protein [Streptomyces rimosus]|uniref:AMP-binding protein n=1 Tax=Streptomyces rimosus TaxID=1927 RepID=UPI0007C56252|nr:AMP-binding protein [Streptomyces rimosus]